MTTTRNANELWALFREEEIEEVFSRSDSSYRHGTYETIVVKDQEGRFWMGHFTLSGDGEQHEWRDGYASPFKEVEPHEVTVTKYRVKRAEPTAFEVSELLHKQCMDELREELPDYFEDGPKA